MRKLSAWRRMRANHLALYPECRICEDINDVHVHHLRYRGPRGLSELPGDLVTLCSFHHNDFHKKFGTAGRHEGSLVKNTIAYVTAMRLECLQEEQAALWQ